MSGGRQSYYEIQLSNTSLIVAFLLAVAIGVAVFMFGVMVGRQQAGAAVQVTPASEGVVEQLGTSEGPTEEAVGGTDADFQQQVLEPVQETQPADAGRPLAAAGGSQQPPPAAQEPPAASAAEGLPAPDPSLASGFVIQVKSTPSRSDADDLQAALAGAGFPAFVVSGEVRGTVYYRVRVGRYRTRAEAERVAAALDRLPQVDETWVTEG